MRDRAEDARESTAEELAGDVVTLDSWIHRVTGAPMEPRAVIGEHDPSADRHTLRTGSGRGVVQTRAPRGHPRRAGRELSGGVRRHGRQFPLVNAVCHALKGFGVRHVEMPATPERVWRALGEARQSG